MKTAIVTSDLCDRHDTMGHIEAAERRPAVMEHLRAEGLLDDRPLPTPEPATDAALLRVHERAYVRLIGEIARAGGAWLDHDTLVSPGGDLAARAAAGAAMLAVDQALGTTRRAFAVVRPPGHHATPEMGMGFCIYNAIAVAAAHALEHHGLARVLIVDWDVHHGNGTQAIFQADPRLLFCSIHQWPHYPGAGWFDEIGTGRGRGATVNVPTPAGTDEAGYLRIMAEVLAPLARRHTPELVLVSAGYDAHAADPLGDMRVTTAGFAALTRAVVALAEELCGGRVAFVLEGGYNLQSLAESVAATIRASDGGVAEEAPSIAGGSALESVVRRARQTHGLG